MPPTDPRILALTDQQIELEFELIKLEKARKDGNSEVFEDDGFDEWDQESESHDSRLSTPPEADSDLLRKIKTSYSEDEWAEVE